MEKSITESREVENIGEPQLVESFSVDVSPETPKKLNYRVYPVSIVSQWYPQVLVQHVKMILGTFAWLVRSTAVN